MLLVTLWGPFRNRCQRATKPQWIYPAGPSVVLQGWGEGSVSHLAALSVVCIHRGQVLGGHLQSKCLCCAPCPLELEEPEGLVKWGPAASSCQDSLGGCSFLNPSRNEVTLAGRCLPPWQLAHEDVLRHSWGENVLKI